MYESTWYVLRHCEIREKAQKENKSRGAQIKHGINFLMYGIDGNGVCQRISRWWNKSGNQCNARLIDRRQFSLVYIITCQYA